MSGARLEDLIGRVAKFSRGEISEFEFLRDMAFRHPVAWRRNGGVTPKTPERIAREKDGRDIARAIRRA